MECFDGTTEEWYDATDMNINRSALKACVVRGLEDVTAYTYYGRSQSTEGSSGEEVARKPDSSSTYFMDDGVGFYVQL